MTEMDKEFDIKHTQQLVKLFTNYKHSTLAGKKKSYLSLKKQRVKSMTRHLIKQINHPLIRILYINAWQVKK